MWMTIMGFIGGPVIKGLIEAYNLHLKATTTDKQTAMNLAGQEIAAQTAETNDIYKLRIAQIGHPWEPEKLAMYITLVFYAKVLLWDKVIGSFVGCSSAEAGTCGIFVTDPVGGYAAVWAGMIMGFYFTKRGAENVTTIIKAFK